jgi:predicted amidohydrolase YtcJ
LIKSAARLGLPCAVHAIGDRAVANVIDAFESSLPLKSGGRHRIEHLQMIRRKDIPRLKRLGIVASMQPSHCPADIDLVRKYWGARGRNAYVFKTLIDRGINLAFGSDAPIEPLRRSRPGRRDLFYPEQRISAAQALNRFTVGPAFAAGQEHCRGYILPGYPADLVVLSDDVTRVAASAIARIEVWTESLIALLAATCHAGLDPASSGKATSRFLALRGDKSLSRATRAPYVTLSGVEG